MSTVVVVRSMRDNILFTDIYYFTTVEKLISTADFFHSTLIPYYFLIEMPLDRYLWRVFNTMLYP